MIRKFRKKPVVIEAMHFTTDNDDGACINSITSWISCNGSPARNDQTNIYIMTLEGEMCASCGDWIIKDAKGGIVTTNPAQILALAIACRELIKIVEANGLAKWKERKDD